MSERLDDRSNLDKLHSLQTQLEDVERELVKRDALLAAIVENAHDAIIARDLNSRIIAWNKAAERLYGWTAEEMIGQTIYKIIDTRKRDEHDHWIHEIEQGRSIGPIRTSRITKTGREVPIVISVSPIVARNGEILGASAIEHEDIDLHE